MGSTAYPKKLRVKITNKSRSIDRYGEYGMSKFVDKLTIDQYGKIRFAKEFVFQKKPEIALSGDKKRVWFLDAAGLW